MTNKKDKRKIEKNNDCEICNIKEEYYILSPLELLHLKKYLNVNLNDFIEQFCDIDIGRFSKLPIAVLKNISDHDQCIFCKNSICILNGIICNNRPFNLTYYNANKKYNLHYRDKNRKKDKSVLLKIWLSKFEDDIESKEICNQMILSLFSFNKKFLSKIGDMTALNMYYNLIFYKMYIEENGKTNLEIMKNRKKELDNLMDYLKEVFEI